MPIDLNKIPNYKNISDAFKINHGACGMVKNLALAILMLYLMFWD